MRQVALLILAATAAVAFVGCGDGRSPAAIVTTVGASSREILAAREIQRYIHQRSGVFCEVRENTESLPGSGNVMLVGTADKPLVAAVADVAGIGDTLASLAPEQYFLRTVPSDGRKVLFVSGADDAAVLHAAYRFAEHLGVRFYLHGDVIPDDRIAFSLPDLDDSTAPLFPVRGIQPFHDFPEGPDWWTLDDYKAAYSQLPKMGMNFFGLHCYPEGGVGPEPAVWIGLRDDIGEDGSVRFSYPSRWFNTLLGGWGYTAKNTSDYADGARTLFAADDHHAEVQEGMTPWPDTAEECTTLFNRTGTFLGNAFGYAHRMGIKTALGTETPMIVPAALKEHLRERGLDPADSTVIQALYEGAFTRIKRTADLDYYWLWTPEGWTWGGNTDTDIANTVSDISAAVRAAEAVDAPFTIATCGWVLGPQSDRALFDRMLPPDSPMSCINRFVGYSPIDPSFATISGRPTWAIPWLENDPAMVLPQLWVGRMWKDAVDARTYGCDGLIGIHWRTRILGPNIAALAGAAWNQSFTARKPRPGPYAENVIFQVAGNRATGDIRGTTEDPVYQMLRHEVDGYRIPVPNGNCTVTLKFCETMCKKAGLRKFDVRIQGRTVIEDLDIYGEAGFMTALDKRFEGIAITDSLLVIEFVRKYNYPVIAGIVIEGNGFTRKINCGGPAYKDYEADDGVAEPRGFETIDFYRDWAQASFGPDVAAEIAAVFADIDGFLPLPASWINGPGGIMPDKRPWEEAGREYEFVERLEALQPRVTGAGNVERFDYWLGTMQYFRAIGRLSCVYAPFLDSVAALEANPDSTARRVRAETETLPAYREMLACLKEVDQYLLATVSTTGCLGMVSNWNQHTFHGVMDKPRNTLIQALGGSLPPDAVPGTAYTGQQRLILPTIRTVLVEGEDLVLPVIVLADSLPKSVTLRWRALGTRSFASVEAAHVDRGVFTAAIKAGALSGNTIEYYVEAVTADGETLRFPATAPGLNQTVVMMPE